MIQHEVAACDRGHGKTGRNVGAAGEGSVHRLGQAEHQLRVGIELQINFDVGETAQGLNAEGNLPAREIAGEQKDTHDSR